MRKLISLLLACVMVLGLFAACGNTAPAETTAAPTEAAPETEAPTEAVVPASDIVILYTNDVHTYIDKVLSYDVIAAVKAELQKEYDYVLLADAGDAVQGTAYGSMDKGETIVKLMNASGYDVATLGNHEFDYGMDGAMNVIEWAEYPYTSCNFYHEEAGVKGDAVLEPFVMFECGADKVAFVGITTPESFTKSTPAYFQDEMGNYIYGISGGEDGAALYADVQTAVDAAYAAGATKVIALGHLGDDPASQPWTSEETIANVSGLTAFIDGHSHSTVEGKEVAGKDGNPVLLTQTGEYFGAIGKMTITAEGELTTELVTAVEGSDPAVKAIKDEWMTEINTKLGEVIGYLDVTLDNYDAGGSRLVRKQETNTGAFAADALYYLFDNMGLDVDVAIMNGGGVRNKAVTGEFSYLTAKSIHTFGNVACLQTITGQQLLDALEWGARATPDAENGGFLHVSGITYDIDTTIPSTVQADEKGVWIGGPTGAYRVHNVKILQDGAYVDLDLNAQYNLAGYNYTLRDLGDGFAMFDGAVNVLDYVMEDYMVLANYIKSFPVDETTGLPTVTAENSPYGQTDYVGRIKLVSNPFTDVPAGEFYTDPVAWAVREGITNGTGDGTTFDPNGTLQRAQFVTMLWRAAGEPVVEYENPFKDVSESDFFYNAVLWAVSEGITNGSDATHFNPYGTTNRAQAVTFLWRYLDEPTVTTASGFSDVVKGMWYEAAINWAVAEGITYGYGDGTFGVDTACNRAHAVTFLYRAIAE